MLSTIEIKVVTYNSTTTYSWILTSNYFQTTYNEPWKITWDMLSNGTNIFVRVTDRAENTIERMLFL